LLAQGHSALSRVKRFFRIVPKSELLKIPATKSISASLLGSGQRIMGFHVGVPATSYSERCRRPRFASLEQILGKIWKRAKYGFRLLGILAGLFVGIVVCVLAHLTLSV